MKAPPESLNISDALPVPNKAIQQITDWLKHFVQALVMQSVSKKSGGMAFKAPNITVSISGFSASSSSGSGSGSGSASAAAFSAAAFASNLAFSASS